MSMISNDVSYDDLATIRAAGLNPTQTMAAQLIWAVRNFVVAHTDLDMKPIQDLRIDDIIQGVRGK